MDEPESAVTLESEVTLRVVLEQDVPVRYTAEVVVDAEELEQLTAGGIEQLALEQALAQAAHASDVVDAWGRRRRGARVQLPAAAEFERLAAAVDHR